MQFLNWWLESLKFKSIISKIERISYAIAFKSVYAGNAIGVLTPNKIGTFIGRALFLKNHDSVSVISSTMLGNLAQLATTALFGTVGFLITISSETNLHFVSEDFPVYAFVVSLCAVVFLLCLFLFPSVLYQLTLKLPYLNRFAERVKYFCSFKRTELLVVFLYSIMRYLVFGFQFYLLLLLLNLNMSFASIFIFICVLYMIVTFIPSPFMGNLFTREAVVLLLLSNYNNAPAVLSASFILWVINIAFPAILGSFIFFFNKEKLNPQKS